MDRGDAALADEPDDAVAEVVLVDAGELVDAEPVVRQQSNDGAGAEPLRSGVGGQARGRGRLSVCAGLAGELVLAEEVDVDALRD